jgi:hypothetical protein
VGTETGGAWWKKRKEASHCGHGKKAGGVAASPVGERRSVPTVAQQEPNHSGRSRVKQEGKNNPKPFQEEKRQKAQSRVPVTALIAWPTFHS